VLVNKDRDTKLSEICEDKCKKCVFATDYNLSHLIALLKEKNVRKAAVCGYNCIPGKFVVKDDGRVECYGKNEEDITHAFCYENYNPLYEPYNPCLPNDNRPARLEFVFRCPPPYRPPQYPYPNYPCPPPEWTPPYNPYPCYFFGSNCFYRPQHSAHANDYDRNDDNHYWPH
ncbi:hypothetical protein THOM_1700, partial [Trachipleistophora hominis]